MRASPSELCTRPVRALCICTVMQVDEEEPVAPAFQPPYLLDASAERAPWEPPSEPTAGFAELLAHHQRRASWLATSAGLLQPADELAEGFAPAPYPRPLPITVPCEAGFEDDGSASARDGESPTGSFGPAASPANADVGSASPQDAELPPLARAAHDADEMPQSLKVVNFPKVYTKDRPGPADGEDLRALFEPYNYKSIYEFVVPKERDHDLSPSYGFVRFARKSEAVAAKNLLDYSEHGGLRLAVTFSENKPTVAVDPHSIKVTNFPKVSNFPGPADEHDIRALFKPFNFQSLEDHSIFVPRDRATGLPRSFAFVRFADTAEAAAAVRMLLAIPTHGGLRVGAAISYARPSHLPYLFDQKRRPHGHGRDNHKVGDGFAAADKAPPPRVVPPLPQHAGNNFQRSYSPSRRHDPVDRALWTELFVQRVSHEATMHDLRSLAKPFGPITRLTLPMKKGMQSAR
jgi:hypothetical protein